MDEKKEYIERGAVIDVILKQPPEPHYPEWYYSDVKNIPVADVAPVVRCKDCRCFEERHYEDEGETPRIKTVCRLFKRQFYPDDYCSYGERKEK